MNVRFQIWVEGETDASDNDTARGALPPLLRRALAELADTDLDISFEVRPLKEVLKKQVGFSKGNYAKGLTLRAKKILQAFQQQDTDDIPTGAFWDQDGKTQATKDRDAVHEHLRRHGRRGQVVGVPILMVEAWLLADLGAFKRLFGAGPSTPLSGNPEELGDPKAVLHGLLADYKGAQDQGWAAIYGKLAEPVSLEVLAKRCPRGFGVLLSDLNTFIKPSLVSETAS